MHITDRHPHYDQYHAKWTQIRDQLEGEEKIKAAGVLYLPFPVSLPASITETDEYKHQYRIYLAGAHFVNYVQQAVDDLVSSVFSRKPIVDDSFPDELEYLNLADVARKLTTTVVSYGRALLLVDYPAVGGDITREQQEQENIAAYHIVHEPLTVINWETERLGGADVLKRVVLEEIIIVDNVEELSYRELIIVDGVYNILIYSEDGMLTETVVPRASGKTLDAIPGIFVGIIENNTSMEQPPVLGISNTNMKHYQNTAELQHTINYIGHPMLAITGAPIGFIDAMNKVDSDGLSNRITVGASQALIIEGETGVASLLQVSPELVHFKQLKQLEMSMGEQGYRIKTEKGGVESAEALRIRSSGNTSKLSSIASQVEDAVKASMQYINAFMGTNVPADMQFDLVKDYLKLAPDSNLINTLNGLINGGRIPDTILFDYLVEVELLDEDVDYEQLRQDSEVSDFGGDFNIGEDDGNSSDDDNDSAGGANISGGA